MNIKLIMIILVLVSGCNYGGELTMEDRYLNSTICLNGVLYYITGYKLAPSFKPDGTLHTCINKDD